MFNRLGAGPLPNLNDGNPILMASADPTMNGGDMPTDGPDIEVSVRQTFGIDSDLQVPAFSRSSDYVPQVDETYRFDRDTTLAILAGFAHNRRSEEHTSELQSLMRISYAVFCLKKKKKKYKHILHTPYIHAT